MTTIVTSENKRTFTARRKILMTTSALAAAGIVSFAPHAAVAKDVGNNDVWEFENKDPVKSGEGYAEFKGDSNGRIIGNLKQEDIGVDGHVHLDADMTAAYGVESGAMNILGKLTSQGDVYLFDQNGVIFGEGSVVDTGSLVATTGNIAKDDLLDGDGIVNIEGVGDNPDAVVDIRGSITVAEAGVAAFVAPTVKNSGVINAKVATLAAGEKVTLDMYGDGLMEIEAGDDLKTAIEHSGEINAEGGVVQISARSAKKAVDNVINMDGVVNASSITQEGGKIVLDGGDNGTVQVAGEMDASGTDGGEVDVRGQNIKVAETAEVKADAVNRDEGQGGNVEVIADEKLDVAGTLSARGQDKSGFIETSGYETVIVKDTASVLGGFWLIDPRDIVIDDAFAGTLEAQLNGGGDASVTTQTPDQGEEGEIRVISTLDWFSDATLNFFANNDIKFQQDGGINATGEGNFVATAQDDIRLESGNNGISTNGGDISLTINDQFTLDEGMVSANGGDIEINNGGIFRANAGSIFNRNGGTITLNQNEGGLIQNAINAIDNSGEGRNTVNIGNGTYNESVVANTDNLSLVGATSQDDEGNTINGATINSNDTAITAETRNLNVESLNINAAQDGIFFVNDLEGENIDITGNTITSGLNGVRFEKEITNSSLNITDNNINNTATTSSRDGVLIRKISRDSDVTIADNDINVNQDGIDIEDIINSTVTITGNTVNSGLDGIEFDQDIAGNSTVTISNNTFNAGDNGLRFEQEIGQAEINVSGNDISAANEGIFIEDDISDATLNITDNNITAGNNGLRFEDEIVNTALNISGNNIDNTTNGSSRDGILIRKISEGSTITISGNTINVDQDGIDIEYISNSTVTIDDNNNITAGLDGIEFDQDIDGNSVVTVDDNTFTAGAHGLNFEQEIGGQAQIIITDNTINADDNGIHFEDDTSNVDPIGSNSSISDEIYIARNDITGGQNGIAFTDDMTNYRHDIVIENNDTIAGTNGNGIAVTGNIAGAEIKIRNNDDISGGQNGIFVEGDMVFSELENGRVTITDNMITGASDNGIYVSDTNSGGSEVEIIGNTIASAGDDGISGSGLESVLVDSNNVNSTGSNGINLSNVANADITGNSVTEASEDGIHVENFLSAEIDGNTIDTVGNDGIEVTNNFSDISGPADSEDLVNNDFTFINDIAFLNLELINESSENFAVNITAQETSVDITNNTVSASGNNGISVSDVNIVNAGSNTVSDSGANGLIIEGGDEISITGDDVSGSDANGILVMEGNGVSSLSDEQNVTFSGNSMTDNTVGARFESGVVDMTGEGNSFTGGEVGLQFAGETVELSDNAPDDDFEGTIGEASFSGQSEYFVELEDGALFTPGEPSVYNATEATYTTDGQGTFGGATLTQAQFDSLEENFYHFPDDNSLGLFFFGAVSEDGDDVTIDNIEDFFQQYGLTAPAGAGLSVTITSLPSVFAGQAADLAGIAPAAGGEPGGIPGDANGDGVISAEEAANLDPAAGSEDANCWGDAVSAAEAGRSVTYSYDTSFESALADAGNCASGGSI